jgi:DNA-binding MarR family transcriptional regulator
MVEDDEQERPTLGFLLVRLGEAIDHRFVEALARLELRPRELRALVVIDRHPGSSQRELARRMPADPGNLVQVLDRLERRSLITRRPGSSDRRRRTLELTPAGARLLARAKRATQRLERELLEPLSDDQREALDAIAFQLWGANRQASSS